jgi:hypothetical protein
MASASDVSTKETGLWVAFKVTQRTDVYLADYASGGSMTPPPVLVAARYSHYYPVA